MKHCNKCLQWKKIEEFYFNSRHCKHSSYCKGCDKENFKLRYHKNRKKILADYKLKYANNEEFRKLKKERSKKYYFSNKKIILKKYLCYKKERRQKDLNYRLREGLRTRLNMALKKGYKYGSAIELLGISIPKFKVYIESKFTENMSWENYGKWHIDHIIPLSKFDLSNTKIMKKLCHYTNLQPLWAIDNKVKYNKIIGV